MVVVQLVQHKFEVTTANKLIVKMVMVWKIYNAF